MAPSNAAVLLQARLLNVQLGSRRRRTIRQCLRTTEGDGNTVNWRLPPIHGIDVVMTPEPICGSSVGNLRQSVAQVALDLRSLDKKNGG